MKPSTPQLDALLATRQFGIADLYRFALIGGDELLYTSYGFDVLWDGDRYSSGGTTGPFFEMDGDGAKVRWARGLETQALDFAVTPGTAQVLGQPFLSAVRVGVFDGATLTFSRAYFALPAGSPSPPLEPVGVIDLFVGRVGEISPAGRSMARFNCPSAIELLNMNLPRNLYQPGCVNTLFDTACALLAGDFDVAGVVASGSTATQINATLGEATGYFDLGKIVFTSGANNGLARMVKTYTAGSPGSLALLYPLAAAPAPGDTFTVYPGCDKAKSTCEEKFNNLANFRGFPYVPQPELAA